MKVDVPTVLVADAKEHILHAALEFQGERIALALAEDANAQVPRAYKASGGPRGR